MGILSINRNLLSKFKSKLLKPLSSSGPCNIRRNAPTIPLTVTGDLQPSSKLMFLIERFQEGSRNYSLLVGAADRSKHHHHQPIPNPFSGCTPPTTTSEQTLCGSCNEWTLFLDNDENFKGDSRQRRVSLWDPTTKRIRTLPLSFLPRPQPVAYIDILCFGFGFEPKSQDYKVISFLDYNYEDGFDSFAETHIELYSLKTNSWKPITASPLDTIPLQAPAVHINVVYYWLALGGSPVCEYSILSFDFADENFSLIRLPKAAELKPINIIGYILVEFHGSLATLLHTDPIKEADQPFCFEVLVWDGQTWTCGLPRVTIGDDVLAGDNRVHKVLDLFRNDYLLLQSCKGELMIFDIKTSKLENLGVLAGLESRELIVFPYFVPI